MSMTNMNEYILYQDMPTFHVIYEEGLVMTQNLKNQ